MTKYVAILGGYPDVGKGTLAASIAYLLKRRGNEVSPVKFDGYLNINSGTMNREDGACSARYNEEEVFVLNDGFCCDADSGYYERFLDQDIEADHNLTNGMLFSTVLNNEKSGTFPSGKILEFNDIKKAAYDGLTRMEGKKDFIFTEVGGTIGDSENGYFIEMLQEMKNRGHDVKYVLLAPVIKLIDKNPDSIISSETKMIRMAIEQLKRKGIRIDALVCRSQGLDCIYEKNRQNLSQRCDIPIDSIFLDPKCDTVYELPSILERQEFIQKLFPEQKNMRSDPLGDFTRRLKSAEKKVKITVLGNTQSNGSFVSLNDAILHSSVKNHSLPEMTWKQKFDGTNDIDGMILTDGFENESNAIRKIKDSGIPFLAICNGFQSVIKELTGKKPDQTTKRCGENGIILTDEKVSGWYGSTFTKERYRLNAGTYSRIESAEFDVLGMNDDGPQIIGTGNDFFIATQFHPEYKSRPTRTHPIIDAFVTEAVK